MIRDKRMQALVPAAKEPITPMIERIRALYEDEGVSSILVIGGAGDYFDVSDLVVMMDTYKPRDVTEKAKKIAEESPSGLRVNIDESGSAGVFKKRKRRRIATESIQRLAAGGRGKVSAKVKGTVEFGSTELDLSAMSQIVEVSQTRAIAAAVETVGTMSVLEEEGLSACVAKVCAEIESSGLDCINQRGERMGNYACPRRLEIQAAVNRLRGIATLK